MKKRQVKIIQDWVNGMSEYRQERIGSLDRLPHLTNETLITITKLIAGAYEKGCNDTRAHKADLASIHDNEELPDNVIRFRGAV